MPSHDEQSEWFETHVRPHEAMLRAWLLSRFSNASDIDEIIQEAYVRILRVEKREKIVSPKAFLFTTARNLCISRLRKESVRATLSLADIDELGVIDDGESVPDVLARSEELEFLTQAIQSLPERCRQVITLRKIYGMSQKEVARELGISVNTVENQGTIGLRKLGTIFRQSKEWRKRHD